MAESKHYRGFEKEEMFLRLWRQAARACPGLTVSALCRIIRSVAPDFLNDLFRTRPCVRKLRYSGYIVNGQTRPDYREYFKPGRIYESIDFNGGDYAIKGYDSGRLGCSNFEVVEG